MSRVEIPAPGDLVIDAQGNVLSGRAVTLKLAGTATNATHYSALTGGTSTTGGLVTHTDGTIVDGSGNRRYVDGGAPLDMTVSGRTRRLEPLPASVERTVRPVSSLSDLAGLTAGDIARLIPGAYTWDINSGPIPLPTGDIEILAGGCTVTQSADVGSVNKWLFAPGDNVTITIRGGLWVGPTVAPADTTLGSAQFVRHNGNGGKVILREGESRYWTNDVFTTENDIIDYDLSGWKFTGRGGLTGGRWSEPVANQSQAGGSVKVRNCIFDGYGQSGTNNKDHAIYNNPAVDTDVEGCVFKNQIGTTGFALHLNSGVSNPPSRNARVCRFVGNVLESTTLQGVATNHTCETVVQGNYFGCTSAHVYAKGDVTTGGNHYVNTDAVNSPVVTPASDTTATAKATRRLALGKGDVFEGTAEVPDVAVSVSDVEVITEAEHRGKANNAIQLGSLLTLTTVTGVAATNLLTKTAHGLTAGTPVVFTALTGGAGLATSTVYYVIATGLTANDFKISATLAGAEFDFTTDITTSTLTSSVALTGIKIRAVRGARFLNAPTVISPGRCLLTYVNADIEFVGARFGNTGRVLEYAPTAPASTRLHTAECDFAQSSSTAVVWTTSPTLISGGDNYGANLWRPTNGGRNSIADAGTIAHGLGSTTATITPTRIQLTGISGHIATVSAISATTITVTLKDAAGAAVAVAESVRWEARP